MSADAIGKVPVRAANGPRAFAWGGTIGALGGLIGLGGAEFRLPVLVGRFRLAALEAVILNKAISMVVVVAALLFRARAVPLEDSLAHADIVLNLLVGSLTGAWFAAGYAIRLSGPTLTRLMLVLLTALAVLMLVEGSFGLPIDGHPLFGDGWLQLTAGVVAGLGVGAVAALLGVAGGELLIPTLVLLFGVDIKLAGSLSLAVSLPTMVVGFVRYRSADAFRALGRERRLVAWMALGSVAGAAIGGMLLGVVPVRALTLLLAVVLAMSAIKVFRHR